MNVNAITFLTLEYEGAITEHFTMTLDQSALSDPYILKSATGLDPDELISRFYATSTIYWVRYLPYHRFYNVKPAARIVAFKIALNPSYVDGESNASLRDRIYKMISFHRGSLVTMQFIDNSYTNPYDDSHVRAVLTGFITHVESDMFSDTAEITITLNCPDPYLYGLYVTPNPGLDPGDIAIDDVSNAPHGFNAMFQFTADATNFLFRSMKDTENANFGISYEFNTGDRLYLGSDPRNRYAYVDKYPAYDFVDRVYLLDKVAPGSIWPILFPGENHMQVGDADVTIESLDYYETYWGI